MTEEPSPLEADDAEGIEPDDAGRIAFDPGDGLYRLLITDVPTGEPGRFRTIIQFWNADASGVAALYDNALPFVQEGLRREAIYVRAAALTDDESARLAAVKKRRQAEKD